MTTETKTTKTQRRPLPAPGEPCRVYHRCTSTFRTLPFGGMINGWLHFRCDCGQDVWVSREEWDRWGREQ